MTVISWLFHLNGPLRLFGKFTRMAVQVESVWVAIGQGSEA